MAWNITHKVQLFLLIYLNVGGLFPRLYLYRQTPSLGLWKASAGVQINHNANRLHIAHASLWSSTQLGWILLTLNKGVCEAIEDNRDESQRNVSELHSYSEKPWVSLVTWQYLYIIQTRCIFAKIKCWIRKIRQEDTAFAENWVNALWQVKAIKGRWASKRS